jgi:hypothetical protein
VWPASGSVAAVRNVTAVVTDLTAFRDVGGGAAALD